MSNDKYKQWMQEVNGYCVSDYNVTVEDLPDFNWRMLFDDGMKAHEAYLEFVETVASELDSCDV